MKLGTLDLILRKPDAFEAIALRRAAAAGEPARSLVAVAALGLYCAGPKDWPTQRQGEDYTDYGRRLLGYLRLYGVQPGAAVFAGVQALNAAAADYEIDPEKVNEYADFFGVSRPFSPAADSQPDTKAPPSGA